MSAGAFWCLAGEPARRGFLLLPAKARRAGSPAKRIIGILACVVLVFFASGALADTATTPGQSAGLSIATADNGSSIENQSIRGGTPRKAGDAGSDDAGSPPNNFDAVHVGGALALVVLLIFGLRFLARKMFALPTVRNSPLVKVLARSPVSPKQQVLLLHVGRRILVVADSGSAMQPLAQITDADEIAALLGQLSNHSGLARTQFNSLFARLRRDFEPEEPSPGPERAGEPDEMPPDSEAETAPIGAAAQTTQELQGLMEKVRLVSRRLGKTV